MHLKLAGAQQQTTLFHLPYRWHGHFPSYTRCSENHNNMCAENRKIRGLKFDTLYWCHWRRIEKFEYGCTTTYHPV